MAQNSLLQSTLNLPCSVVIVTAAHRDERGAATATATFVCQTPPLIAISLSNSSATRGLIDKSGEFAVNVITEKQMETAKRLGRQNGHADDKLAQLGIPSLSAAAIHAPLLPDCFANYECKVKTCFALADGKQYILVGEVIASRTNQELRPVIWWKNSYFKVGQECEI
jgi:flavin reductase (DIM6/NTAB) family NADH-FMN oxidoreductase RutF